MENLIRKKTFKYSTVFSIFFFLACSGDDVAPVIQVPSISYGTATLNAVFFQEGNATAPTVNWNGHQGGFSLTSAVPGLNINTINGVLSWNQDLPIGTHNLQVIAANNAGQTPINLVLNNPFQGVFTGTQAGSFFIEVEFFENETAVVRLKDNTNNTVNNSATWTKNGEAILVNFSFFDTNFSLLGDLNLGVAAVYSGIIYNEHDAIPGNESTSFEVTLN